MKTPFLILIFSALTLGLSAQPQSVLSRNVALDTAQALKGPNLKHYSQTFYKVGFMVPAEDNKYMKYGRSYELGIGYRYKRKINNWYALGYEASYFFSSYSLRNFLNYPISDTVSIRSERYMQRGVNVSLYQRINYGRRGNYLGKYIDLAIWAESPFWNKHKYRFEQQGFQRFFATDGNLSLRRLPWDNLFNYGTQVRLGFNKISFYGTYRLSELFNNKQNLPGLTPFIAGFQIGI
jgi:hypothetical protein